MATLDDVMLELRALHRKADALLARGRGDAGEEFCAAVLQHWGSQPFLAADLLEWTDLAPKLRHDVREAAQALCGTPSRPTARQLGNALRRLSTIPLMWHRVEGNDDRGTMVWAVTELQD